MKRFYRVAIDKIPFGAVVEHREPPLLGEVIVHVIDTRARGDFKVAVVDASNAEHQKNSEMPGVEVLAEAEAAELAAEYQPEVTREALDPRTRKVEKIRVPKVDLKKVLQVHEEEAKKRSSKNAGG